MDATVRVSYVELYNEQIYDLLNLSDTSQSDSLRIFDDKNKVDNVVNYVILIELSFVSRVFQSLEPKKLLFEIAMKSMDC